MLRIARKCEGSPDGPNIFGTQKTATTQPLRIRPNLHANTPQRDPNIRNHTFIFTRMSDEDESPGRSPTS